jgi:hypothetical protein
VQNTAQTSITETAMTMKSKIFQDESSTQATHPHASVAEKLDTNPFAQLVGHVILRWHQFHENRSIFHNSKAGCRTTTLEINGFGGHAFDASNCWQTQIAHMLANIQQYMHTINMKTMKPYNRRSKQAKKARIKTN